MEDRSLCQKWWEEDGVARSPVPLLLRARKVAGGGAKEDLHDRETYLVAVRGKGDFDLR